tara:strand:- start:935 stop:1063 length:129 start_codon:yes stop_codon:yes gene_type:complete
MIKRLKNTLENRKKIAEAIIKYREKKKLKKFKLPILKWTTRK